MPGPASEAVLRATPVSAAAVPPASSAPTVLSAASSGETTRPSGIAHWSSSMPTATVAATAHSRAGEARAGQRSTASTASGPSSARFPVSCSIVVSDPRPVTYH